jgi:protocatechuate 3,4-dioxygenase beta subunit
MKRRTFIKKSSYIVFGVSVFGSICWKDGKFIGDTPTTTDILGPFYRPNAPMKSNINPKEFKGERLYLSGIVYKEDGKTPYENCMVEVWQCDGQANYDNLTEEFNYRGKQLTKADGKYRFITVQPVPYKPNPKRDYYRPAHIHMRVSGVEQQDLITQIYFKGDPHINEDGTANAPEAINRILDIKKTTKGENEVVFNITMKREFAPDNSVFEKICGLYKMNTKGYFEFYREGDLLMLKWDGQIWEGFKYKGENEFFGGSGSQEAIAKFELQPNMNVKVIMTYNNDTTNPIEGIKIIKY